MYSDLGYLLVGQLIEDLTGRTLAELAAARTGLRFGTPPGPAVATERCPWRKRLIVGEVHDENAAAMGGVAGQAGAFGTLALVTAAARSWLAGRVVSTRLHAEARTCWATSSTDDRFGLGWWLTARPGLGGPVAGARGYGCPGFVGTRIWLEPEYDYGVVILSNRIHSDRSGSREPFLAWCDALFSAIAAELR